jgi:hypothetical protein
LVCWAGSAGAQSTTNEPARYKTKVTCYEGKEEAGVGNSGINFTPESTFPEPVAKNRISSRGHELEVKWRFVRRDKEKDVYRFLFVRATETSSTNQAPAFKEVQFDGRKIIVAKDPLHTVVMETPSEEELKQALQN